MSPKKKIVIAVGAVVVVLTAALLFVSNYLVNYAIGRSGDGGDREVALEVEASPDSVEAIIETNRAQYSADIDAFAATHPGENVTLTAADGLTLHGVRYANAETAATPLGDCSARLPRRPHRRAESGDALLRGRLSGDRARPARLRRQRRRLRRHGLA